MPGVYLSHSLIITLSSVPGVTSAQDRQNLKYCYLLITSFLLIADVCALPLPAVFWGYSNLIIVS